jgi:outer membrane murein-binding lipoprotein Lpp
VRRLVTLAAAGLLTAPLLTGCGSDGSSADCPTVAHDVSGQVDALRSSIGTAAADPRDAATALRRIQQHLDDIAGRTNGDAAATKAVGDLSLAVSNVKNDLDNGVRHPDITPVTRGSAALTAACPTKG